jgi:hypothetical protein
MKRTIEIDDIMNMPKYTRKRVTELFAGRESLTPREIAGADIPVDDRMLVMSCILARHDPTRSVARRIALEVLPNDAPAVIRQWLETGDEAIRVAAKEAAKGAAYEVEYEVVYKAADDAEDDAAYDADDDAAYEAAYRAADGAAYDAEMEKYIGWAVEFLEEKETSE